MRTLLSWLVSLLAAALISIPLTYLVGFALTPLLWRLEPITGMELAGHSGPSDWIIILLFCVFFPAVLAGLRWLRRIGQPR